MDQQFICDRRAHQGPIKFVCIRKDCNCMSLCCISCLLEVHVCHQIKDFIQLEEAIQKTKELKNYYLEISKSFDTLEKMCSNFMKEIGSLIKKHDIYRKNPNFAQLDFMVKEMKMINIKEKISTIQDCFSKSMQSIKESFGLITECLKTENTIEDEQQSFELVKKKKTKLEQSIQEEEDKEKYKLKLKKEEIKEDILCLAISQDNKYVASGGQNENITLWKVENLELVQEYGGGNSIQCLLFSPNNEILVAAEQDTILFFSLNSNNFNSFKQLFGHEGKINSLAMTNDSTQLISASEDQTIKVWDVNSFKIIVTKMIKNQVNEVVLSNDQKYLGCCVGNEEIFFYVFDWTKFPNIKQLIELRIPAKVNCIQFSPDNNSILINIEKTVYVWSIDSLLQSLRAPPQRSFNKYISFYSKLSNDGSILCLYDYKQIHIINYQSQELIQSLDIDSAINKSMVITSDIKYIIASSDKEIYQFEQQ